MTTQNGTAPMPENATPLPAHLVSSSDHYEEDELQVRHQLGLRSTYFPKETDSAKGMHPDQRPCPSWCWVGKHDTWDHPMDIESPMSASHTPDMRIAVLLTRYKGWNHADSVHAATVEVSLEQLGQSKPSINLGRRSRGDNQLGRYAELVDLAVEDARELARVLNYFADMATGKVDS